MQKETKNKKALAINIFIALFLVFLIYLTINSFHLIEYLQFQYYMSQITNIPFFNVTTMTHVPWIQLNFMYAYFTIPMILTIIILTYSIIENYHKNHILKKNLLIFLVLTIILFVVFMISVQYYMDYALMQDVILRT